MWHHPKIKFVHARGEATGLPDSSLDLIAYGFIFHECPPAAIRNILREGYRLLKPGGIMHIVDVDIRYGYGPEWKRRKGEICKPGHNCSIRCLYATPVAYKHGRWICRFLSHTNMVDEIVESYRRQIW